MWFKVPRIKRDWADAIEHLRNADRVMARIIEHVGPCTLHPRRNYFGALCQAILSQQVSMAVATIFFARLRAKLPGGRVTPKAVLKLEPEELRSIGLSRQKVVYVRDLAERFASGEIPTRRFPRMTDEQIIESLLPIKGIGRWTAEMFLIFVLNRPDLLPVDDLGVRKAVQIQYRLAELPRATDLIEVAEPWRPWRTIATWYLWRSGPAGVTPL